MLLDLYKKFRKANDMRNRLCHHEPMWKDRYAAKTPLHRIVLKVKAKYNLNLYLLNSMAPEMKEGLLFSGVLGFRDIDEHFDTLSARVPPWRNTLRDMNPQSRLRQCE